MVRSLWSGATGMNAQQTNVDTIANNLANVNSVGYKAQVAQFKSLLYQNLQSVTTTANGDPKPTTSQVGLGVRTSSINQIFTQEVFWIPLPTLRSRLRVTVSLLCVARKAISSIRETVTLHGRLRAETV